MSGEIMVKIVKEPIDIPSVLSYVTDPEAGGIDLFIGTTRNNAQGKDVLYLEYEAYPEMALPMMERLAAEISAKWSLKKIAMIHRIGRVDIGEASVLIAVSAPHRKEAFEACRYAIDTLKKTIPIWKKEYFKDGSKWVDGSTGNEKP